MTYTYPRPQTVYKDTLFLMVETIESKQFDEYQIPYTYKDGIRILKIKHDFLIAAIDQGIVNVYQKPGAFNDKPFVRVPLQIQLAII